jgi:hypothetical protein
MLAGAALVVGGLACRDSPTAVPDALTHPPTAPTVAADALATIHGVVDDPLVHALVAGVPEPGSKQVSQALHAVSEAAADGLSWALDHALETARHVVQQDGVVDDAVVEAAFGLVLDYADAMLDHGRTNEEVEGEPQEVRR